MSTFVVFILFCQALGAVIGATTAVWSQVAYVRAMRDGHIDHAERKHLDIIAHGLRWGMSLMLISSLALVIAAYISGAATQPAVTESYWALIFFAVIILIISLELSRKRITFALGSAIAFTAWLFLAYIALGRMPPIEFGTTVAFFVVASGIFYGILKYAHFIARPK